MFTPGIRIYWCQNHFFIIENDFPDIKLYSLRISAIFSKKKNFHVSQIFHDFSFEKCL